MTNEHTSREWQRIRELANEYGSKGYDVVYPRTKFDVPGFLRDEEYIPDLVVTSADENLIIEVKTTQSVRHDKHISRISELVNRNPGWQFLFVLTNPKRGEARSAASPRSERWHELLEKSRHLALAAPELTEAAFVLAWAAFEGAIREATVSEGAGSEGKTPTAKSPMSQLRDAAILGLVDRKDLPRLEMLFAMRTSIVHATEGPRPSPADVAVLQRLVEDVTRIARSNEVRVTPEQSRDWRDWLLLTSIPLVHIGDGEQVLGFGSGTMLDFEGRRFLVTAGHVAKIDSKGWAIVVQQHPDGRMEYYKPNAFVHVGEGRRSTASLRLIDLCVAQVAPNLETWYEFRTPRGLFDKRPHHVFEASACAEPEPDQIYGFSGRVHTEMHAPQVYASEMTVFPGLSYKRTEDEEHVFSLPVPHPGHEAFRGSSGSPICDFAQRLVSIVVRGTPDDNTIRGVAIHRVLPALRFLAAHSTTEGNDEA